MERRRWSRDKRKSARGQTGQSLGGENAHRRQPGPEVAVGALSNLSEGRFLVTAAEKRCGLDHLHHAVRRYGELGTLRVLQPVIKAGLNARTCRNLTWQNVYIIMPVTISLPLPALDSIVLALVKISPSRSETKYLGFQGGTPLQPSKGGSRYEIPRLQLGTT